MYYIVYIIRSLPYPDRIYIGYTTNLKQRLETHNSGRSIHTEKNKPWELIAFFGFKSKSTAIAFEKYLKSHAGRVFAAKRFW